jgi:ABC-type transport system involved in multi-copper enzyme maturation permease subunit
MFNLIKADLYRIVKGKAIWITFFLLLIFLIVSALAGSVGTAGIYNETLDTVMSENTKLSGSLVQLYQMATGDNLFYFFLPIMVIVITSDFNNRTAGNVLARGISRTKFYLTKLLLVTFLSLIFVAVYVTVPLIVGTLRYGMGTAFETFDYFKILCTQLPIYLAIIALGTFIGFTFKKTATLNAIYIPIFIVSQLAITILVQFNTRFKFLFDYELAIFIRKNAFNSNITSTDIMHSVILGISVIIVVSTIGISLFKKSEIK